MSEVRETSYIGEENLVVTIPLMEYRDLITLKAVHTNELQSTRLECEEETSRAWSAYAKVCEENRILKTKYDTLCKGGTVGKCQTREEDEVCE